MIHHQKTMKVKKKESEKKKIKEAFGLTKGGFLTSAIVIGIIFLVGN